MEKNNYRIIGVDFDGTLAVSKNIYPNIGEPITEVIDYILEEQKKGAYLVLITIRENEERMIKYEILFWHSMLEWLLK